MAEASGAAHTDPVTCLRSGSLVIVNGWMHNSDMFNLILDPYNSYGTDHFL